jgi:myosin heavy subunit
LNLKIIFFLCLYKIKEQNEIFSALIGILHVGNLNFKSNDEGYSIFVHSNQSKHTLDAISVKYCL